MRMIQVKSSQIDKVGYDIATERDNGQTIRFYRRFPGGAELLTEMTA